MRVSRPSPERRRSRRCGRSPGGIPRPAPTRPAPPPPSLPGCRRANHPGERLHETGDDIPYRGHGGTRPAKRSGDSLKLFEETGPVRRPAHDGGLPHGFDRLPGEEAGTIRTVVPDAFHQSRDFRLQFHHAPFSPARNQAPGAGYAFSRASSSTANRFKVTAGGMKRGNVFRTRKKRPAAAEDRGGEAGRLRLFLLRRRAKPTPRQPPRRVRPRPARQPSPGGSRRRRPAA